MVKYKLIKCYPGSPELGTIHEFGNGDWLGAYTYDECNNEFWKKVKEKDYEILSFKGNFKDSDERVLILDEYGLYVYSVDKTKYHLHEIINPEYKIYSIKRLSDGEVFTLGDEVVYEGKCSYAHYTIGDFFIKENTVLVRSSGFLICEYLKDIKKFKQPLFVTEDGKEIFDGDKTFGIDENFKPLSTNDYEWINGQKPNKLHKHFSTKKAAVIYLLSFIDRFLED